MDLTKVAEIVQDTFKQALEEKRYRFGMPQPRGIGNKVASGSLRDSIQAVATNDGILVFMNDYGKWVQSGRKAGKYVPIKPLEEWIKRRGINFKSKFGKTLTTRQMAYAISTNIAKYGIPSDPGWMDVAIENLYNNKELEELLGELTVDDLINALEGI